MTAMIDQLDFHEIEPLGPRIAGDIDLGQLYDSWRRRYAAAIPGGRYYAVVMLTFYQFQAPNGTTEAVCERDYLICLDPQQPTETEQFGNAEYVTVGAGNIDDPDLAKRYSVELSRTAVAWPFRLAGHIERFQG